MVHERFLGELLQGALPVERTVADRYVVRLEKATTTFRTGLALVELHGRASAVDRPSVSVDATVVATLEVLGLQQQSPALRVGVEVLAFTVRDVEVAGWSAPVERLAEELARRRADDFNDLLAPLEIPAGVEQALSLPAVANDQVKIPELTLPLVARVEQVLVANQRLWISIDMMEVDVGGNGTTPAPQQRNGGLR